MSTKVGRTLLVGCNGGLLQAHGHDRWEIRLLGLAGKGGVRSIVLDYQNPDRIYAATRKDGVQRSDDGGKVWAAVNEGLLYRDVWCLTQHPRTGELLAGTEPASVFKSSDGGETWTDCRQVRNLPETQFWTFPRPPHLAHVKDIAVRQEDHKVIFGAIEEGWVIRSTDGGETWETLKQGVEFDAHFVTVMPDDPNVVVVTSGTGVYRSENGGETFVKSDRGIRGALASYMSPAAVHPSRPRTLFAGAADAPPPFWRARAEGANAGFLS